MKIKLAPGRALRDPQTHELMGADEVRDVPNNIYWRRRLRDGDVVAVDDHAHHRRGHRQEHEGEERGA